MEPDPQGAGHPYAYNTSNELTSTPTLSYSYDSDGNLKSKSDGTTYSWDYENRLSKVVLPGTGGTVSFRYDAFGRRAQKSFVQGTTTTTTIYLYDGPNALEEVDLNGNVLARYTQDLGIDQPLSQLRSGTTSYYQQDALGSVTSLSNATGALANTYTYDSFGNTTVSSGTVTNTFRYTGREFDTETGAYFYRARYYDQGIGRFSSEDRFRFGAGSNNFYAYVSNHPTSSVDPSGLCKIEVRFARLGSFCGKTYYHAYILTSGDGIVSYFRSGPANKDVGSSAEGAAAASGVTRRCCSSGGKGYTPSGFGPLTISFGTYIPLTPDWEIAASPVLNVLDNAAPCYAYDYALTRAMRAIQDANIPYDPFTYNSNATATTALTGAGLPYGQPPVWAPGWGVSLPVGH